MDWLSRYYRSHPQSHWFVPLAISVAAITVAVSGLGWMYLVQTRSPSINSKSVASSATSTKNSNGEVIWLTPSYPPAPPSPASCNNQSGPSVSNDCFQALSRAYAAQAAQAIQSLAPSCKFRQALMRIGKNQSLRASVKTTYTPPNNNCRFQLAISNVSGKVIFRRSGDLGSEGTGEDIDIGVASLIPDTDQLIISDESCGSGGCSADVRILSFATGGAAEIFAFDYDQQDWQVIGHKLRFSGDLSPSGKPVKLITIAVGFDSSGRPIAPNAHDEKEFYDQLAEPTTEHYLESAIADLKKAADEVTIASTFEQTADAELKPYRDTFKRILGCQGTDNECLTSRAQILASMNYPAGTRAWNSLSLLMDVSEWAIVSSNIEKDLLDEEGKIAALSRQQDADNFDATSEAEANELAKDLILLPQIGAATAKVAVAPIEMFGLAPPEPLQAVKQGISHMEAAVADIYLASICISPNVVSTKCDSRIDNPESEVPGFQDSINSAQQLISPVSH